MKMMDDFEIDGGTAFVCMIQGGLMAASTFHSIAKLLGYSDSGWVEVLSPGLFFPCVFVFGAILLIVCACFAIFPLMAIRGISIILGKLEGAK
jgi:hypothetical protein